MRKTISVLMSICLCICTVLFITGCKKKITSLNVSFYVDETLYQTVKVSSGKIKEMPNDPEKTGYEFEGWFYDKETFENEFLVDSLSDNPIKKNTAIYADFTAIDYTISYKNTKDATNSNPTTYNIETSTITLDNLSKEGYTFDGWYIGSKKVTKISLGSYGNRNLEAKWSLANYTISYSNTKDAPNSNEESYNIETSTITLDNLSKDGYTFEGWFVGEDEVTEITLGSTGNKNLEAKWSLIEYTATFKNGNDIVDTRTFTVEDTVIEDIPEVPEKDYYYGVWGNYEIEANDIEIIAIYKPINYSINYANTKDATNNNRTYYNIETSTFTLNDLSKEGCTFEGWFVGEDEVTEITIGSHGVKNLEAKWSFVEYTISYELNGGTNDPSNPLTYNIEDGAITFKSPTKDGKLFDGWEVNGVLVVAFSSSLADDITLEATWIDEVELSYTKDSDDNITITGFIDDSIKSTLRILDIAETYGGYKVVGIANNAFKGYSALESVTMPDSVESIGDYAFRDCTNLERITIPNSLRNIGYCTFYGCTSLIYTEERYINYLGNDTNPYFIAMKVTNRSLFSYTLNDDTKIIYGCFSSCTNLANLTIPEGVVIIGNSAFAYCSSLRSVTLSNSVEIIDDYAFQKCGSLTSITFGDCLKTIGTLSFQNCTSLQSVMMPNSVESIGVSAFQNCTNLVDVNISNKLIMISVSAFYECTNLANLTIPEGVEAIGESAFSGCLNLESITIPSSVVRIYSSAFSDCEKLKNVYIQSANVANEITTYSSCGWIVTYTDVVHIEVSITTIGSYITDNFTKGSTTVVGEVTYNIYTKNS